jgi:sugar lactone lactonase YvrE
MLSAGIFTYDTTYRFSAIATNLNDPVYLSVDDSSNIFYSSYNLQTVNKIDAAGNLSTFVQNIGSMGTTIDKSGNLFATAYNGQAYIGKIDRDGSVTQMASENRGLSGLAVDASGNFFAANSIRNTVDKITPQGVVSVFASGLFSVSGVAVGKDGSVYTTNYSSVAYNNLNGVVMKITPSGQVSTFATGINYNGSSGLVLDDNDNVFVTSVNQGTSVGSVMKITPSGVVSTIATDLSFPVGIAMDHQGNLYVAEESVTDGEVVKLIAH